MEYDDKTPWGTYHKAYYYDNNHNACDKEKAHEMHIIEFDEQGKFVQETIAFTNRNKDNSDL